MPDDDHASRVIVVGSSAGGLDALKQLLGAAHPGLRWCFVIAQHLAPDDTSALASLLTRSTSLRVVEATDGLALGPDMVFVTPPRTDITVSATASNAITVNTVTSTAMIPMPSNAITPARPGSARNAPSQSRAERLSPSGSHLARAVSDSSSGTSVAASRSVPMRRVRRCAGDSVSMSRR